MQIGINLTISSNKLTERWAVGLETIILCSVYDCAKNEGKERAEKMAVKVKSIIFNELSEVGLV